MKTRDAAILALAVFLAVAISAASSSPVFAQYACPPGYSYYGGSCYPGYSNYCPPGYAYVGGSCYPPSSYNPYNNCQYAYPYYQNGYPYYYNGYPYYQNSYPYYNTGSCNYPGYGNNYYNNYYGYGYGYYGSGYYGNGYRWHHRHW